MSRSLQRSIILCNSLSLFIAFMPFLFAIQVMIISGSGSITFPLISQPLLLLLPILLNASRLTTLSRVLLSFITPTIIIGYSIYNKLMGLDIQTSSYVGIRITMVASSILPFLLFTDKEKYIMILSMSTAILLILGFDPIHAFFNVSYTDVGLTESVYPLTNIRAIIGIIVIGACALILKNLFEKSERANENLIRELGEKNNDIRSQLKEISVQSENILLQKSVIEKQYSKILQREANLIESKNQLLLANTVIKNQQQLLHKENIDLEEKLLEQNTILERTNKELIQMNAGLHQFSYMASHNLRGPVATLLGLISLVPTEKLDTELFNLLTKSQQTVEKLNDVINDLIHVENINNSLLKTKDKIYWQELIDVIVVQYEKEINENNIEIKLNLTEAPYIVSIESIIRNILYNLINNSIKFRASDRDLIIQINTKVIQDKILLEVMDNGLGMDLPKIGDKLFMMYKRFHNHVAGKGLGLYFTKVQTEIIGGTIKVSSEPNQYTTFTLEFPSEFQN